MDPLKWRERYASSSDATDDDVDAPPPLTEGQQRFINTGYMSFTQIRRQWAARQPIEELMNGPNATSTSGSSLQAPSSALAPRRSSRLTLGQQQSANQLESPANNDNRKIDRRITQTSSDDSSDSEDENDLMAESSASVDVPAIMEALRTNQPFRRPIKLGSMIDILTVIWEDEMDWNAQ